jgi:hypothetical protein
MKTDLKNWIVIMRVLFHKENVCNFYLHTTDALSPKVAEASQIYLRDAHVLPTTTTYYTRITYTLTWNFKQEINQFVFHFLTDF